MVLDCYTWAEDEAPLWENLLACPAAPTLYFFGLILESRGWDFWQPEVLCVREEKKERQRERALKRQRKVEAFSNRDTLWENKMNEPASLRFHNRYLSINSLVLFIYVLFLVAERLFPTCRKFPPAPASSSYQVT